MNIGSKTATRKQQIEKEAAALFHEKGYAASSMRDLAQRVGIEAGSLYSHFKSKESILQKICFDMANSFFQSLDAIENLGLDAELQLRNAIKAHLSVLTEDPEETIVFQNEWKHLSEPYLADFISMRKDYENRFRKILEQGIKDGLFENHDLKILSLTLLSALNNTSTWFKKSRDKSEDIGEKLSNIFLTGLLKQK